MYKNPGGKKRDINSIKNNNAKFKPIILNKYGLIIVILLYSSSARKMYASIKCTQQKLPVAFSIKKLQTSLFIEMNNSLPPRL